jgi:hypothetical protein
VQLGLPGVGGHVGIVAVEDVFGRVRAGRARGQRAGRIGADDAHDDVMAAIEPTKKLTEEGKTYLQAVPSLR